MVPVQPESGLSRKGEMNPEHQERTVQHCRKGSDLCKGLEREPTVGGEGFQTAGTCWAGFSIRSALTSPASSARGSGCGDGLSGSARRPPASGRPKPRPLPPCLDPAQGQRPADLCPGSSPGVGSEECGGRGDINRPPRDRQRGCEFAHLSTRPRCAGLPQPPALRPGRLWAREATAIRGELCRRSGHHLPDPCSRG